MDSSLTSRNLYELNDIKRHIVCWVRPHDPCWSNGHTPHLWKQTERPAPWETNWPGSQCHSQPRIGFTVAHTGAFIILHIANFETSWILHLGAPWSTSRTHESCPALKNWFVNVSPIRFAHAETTPSVHMWAMFVIGSDPFHTASLISSLSIT